MIPANICKMICEHCGREFVSPIQIDDPRSPNVVITRNVIVCPHPDCKKDSTCDDVYKTE